MTPPVAIYRPRTRTLLLAVGDQCITIDEDRVLRFADALRAVAPMIGPRSSLRIRNPSGQLSVPVEEIVLLADAIDAAFGVPALAAQLVTVA